MTIAWQVRRFEAYLEQQLQKQLGEARGQEYYGYYTGTRAKIIPVLAEIKAAQPSINDHSDRHTANVLDNIFELAGEDIEPALLTGLELYCLGMAAWLHDAGNIDGREGHHLKVGEHFDAARGTSPAVLQERKLVSQIAKSHTGTSNTGSKDTLGPLDTTAVLLSNQVRLRECAAVFRFADELAEGSQRTNDFMLHSHRYSEESEIHHKYAEATSLKIDRGNDRIVLAINIDLDGYLPRGEEGIAELHDFLVYCFRRIVKLDHERKYTSHFSEHILSPFRFTKITFSFFHNREEVDIGLQPLTLSNLVVPGDDARPLSALSPLYDAKELCRILSETCCEGKAS